MSCTWYTLPTVVRSSSRRYIQPDHRGRFALGQFTRGHSSFLLNVAEDGVITLTPAEVLPASVTPVVNPRAGRRRAPAKKAAAAAAEKPQEQERP